MTKKMINREAFVAGSSVFRPKVRLDGGKTSYYNPETFYQTDTSDKDSDYWMPEEKEENITKGDIDK